MGRGFRTGLVALILALSFGTLSCSATIVKRGEDYDSRLATVCFIPTCDDYQKDAEREVRRCLEIRAPKDKYGNAIIDQSELKSYIVGSLKTLKSYGKGYRMEIVRDNPEKDK